MAYVLDILPEWVAVMLMDVLSGKYFKACSLFLLMGMSGSSTQACAPIQEASDLMQAFVERKNVPGISVSVGMRGEHLWSFGLGFADMEQSVPINPMKTKFRVGSTVKPMTAFALMTLVARGQMDLDEDVRSLVPSFPPKTHPFTIRQLAGHLAGIRHYKDKEAYSRTYYDSVRAALTFFEDDHLVRVPGEAWHYSSYGYNLLSVVIEKASGMPFLNYMQEAVFTPLKMTATVPDHLAPIIPGRGRYYRYEEGVLSNEPEVDNSYKWASGGMLSSTYDLMTFGLAHLNDTFVSAEMRETLWTEQRTSSGEGTGYGLGWRLVTDSEGHQWIGHGGGSIGGTTQLWLFPETGLVLALASNLTELDYEDVLPRLRALFSEARQCTVTVTSIE